MGLNGLYFARIWALASKALPVRKAKLYGQGKVCAQRMKNCEKESIASKNPTQKVAITTANIKHIRRQLHDRKIQYASDTT